MMATGYCWWWCWWWSAGTHVLLEAAKEAKVKLFVHVSTDEVYGDGISGVASHEGSVLEPTNPYS